MRVVADSHSLLYYLFTPDRLSEPAFDALGNAEKSDGLVVSAATLGDLWYSSHKIGERALTPGAFESLHTTVLDPENEGFEVPVESGRSLGGVLGDGDTESAALIEEATIDAYGVDEQLGGFHAKLEEFVEVPFTTVVLGVEVTVVEIDLSASGRLVAVCRRGGESQPVDLRDLPLPTPPPDGVEWIRAYRRWAAEGLA